MEEKNLVELARNGDIQAFASLYETVYQDLYRFALFTMKNKEEAEDAVSESVIAAYESIHKLRKAESFRSWMFQIVANQCKKIWKRREHFLDGTVADKAGVSFEMEEHMDLWCCFSCLTEKERMVLAMHVFGGYNSREIGKLLKMAPGTVRSLKSRAIIRMRHMLGGKV